MSDHSPQIPIWRTVIGGYRDGVGALFRDGRLFRYFVYASALTLVLMGGHLYANLGGPWRSGPAASASQIANLLFGLLISVVAAVAISPLTVAVHRKLLLDERPHGPYFAAMFRGTYLRVAAATIAVYGLFFLAELSMYPVIYLVYGLNPLNTRALAAAYAAQPTIALVATLLAWGAYFLAALIATRFAFAFPAISINAPGASLQQSYAETRGSMWRLFFVFLLTLLLPFAAFVIFISAASVLFVIGNPEAMRYPDRAGDMMVLSPPFLVVYAVGFMLMMAILVVIAAATARAYEIRVNRGMTGVAEVFA